MLGGRPGRVAADACSSCAGNGIDNNTLAGKGLTDSSRSQFAADGQKILAGNGNALRLDLLFDERIQFLHHEKLVHLCSKLADQSHGQRMDHSELEGGNVREDLTHILVADTGGDDADLECHASPCD